VGSLFTHAIDLGQHFVTRTRLGADIQVSARYSRFSIIG